MTIEEAIYCMKSYLPGNEVEGCLSCPNCGIEYIDEEPPKEET